MKDGRSYSRKTLSSWISPLVLLLWTVNGRRPEEDWRLDSKPFEPGVCRGPILKWEHPYYWCPGRVILDQIYRHHFALPGKEMNAIMKTGTGKQVKKVKSQCAHVGVRGNSPCDIFWRQKLESTALKKTSPLLSSSSSHPLNQCIPLSPSKWKHISISIRTYIHKGCQMIWQESMSKMSPNQNGWVHCN